VVVGEEGLPRLRAPSLGALAASRRPTRRTKDGGSVTLRDSYIDGEIEIESTRGSIDVRDSRIEDKRSLKDNRGGPLAILGNTISGDLECSGNAPPPGGGGNAVDGDTKGQCGGL
jgi:hypothetical protein